ncbi:protein PBDC1 isoform X2 [Hydra vulgaris]|uniref:Protein PBDC1 isoform X2 n=1 Tax=Hydra vulgaris TaxID=6087 RepID=A0ABM4BJT1_HYDVU
MDISQQIDNLKFSNKDKTIKDVNTDDTANNYVNDSSVELLWAMKAHKHAEVYMKLLKAVDSSKVKLTKYDDLIYRMFKKDFSDINVEQLDEDMFKSKTAKEKWRPFCEDFKGKIESYNFGTLIRKNVHEDYSEDNSFLTTRIQFLAVEIVRNRHGLNSFYKNVKESQISSEPLPAD